MFITSSVAQTNDEAAILKLIAPTIITLYKVIIARYDAILDQSSSISRITRATLAKWLLEFLGIPRIFLGIPRNKGVNFHGKFGLGIPRNS